MATNSSAAIAYNLARLREEAGISQGELARRIGVARPRISELESGNANPRIATLDRIAEELEVPVASILRKIPASALAG